MVAALPEACAGILPTQFYLAENGVTVLCPDAEVGDKGSVNGRTYTKHN